MYFPDLLEQYQRLMKQMKRKGITSGEMFREVKQAIEWMETGYDPAEYRAVTRTDAYTMDPYHMQSYVSYLNSDDEQLLPEFLQVIKKDIVSRWIPNEGDQYKAEEFIRRYYQDFNKLESKSSESKKAILNAFMGLTDNEKAAFIAVRAEKMTFSKAAAMLGVTRGTVGSYINRAEKKIKKNIGQVNHDEIMKDAV